MQNIHDFPTYGLFAGCVTKGLVGFPPCSPTIEFLSSRKLKKVIFCGSSAICQGAILINELKCLQWAIEN